MIKILQQYQYPILYPLRHEDFVHSKWTKRGSNKNKLQEPPFSFSKRWMIKTLASRE